MLFAGAATLVVARVLRTFRGDPAIARPPRGLCQTFRAPLLCRRGETLLMRIHLVLMGVASDGAGDALFPVLHDRLLRGFWVLLCQELEHLVVQTDVVALQVAVGLVPLQVDAEARELFVASRVPPVL